MIFWRAAESELTRVIYS